ncbi:chitin binding [Pelomyxa schiedti]|nr:chitin binding [Pelomyxa schiedti]
MTLAYLLDHYGINPAVILSLIAIDSGASLQSSSDTNTLFKVGNGNGHFDCTWQCPRSNGKVVNLDIDQFSTLASVLAMRIKIKGDTPIYLSHNFFSNTNELSQAYRSYIEDPQKAIILSGLNLHLHHTLAYSFDRVGMRTPWEGRSRLRRDELESAAVLYAHKKTIFDPIFGSEKLQTCPPSSDPTLECGLISVSDALHLCEVVNKATDVYDYSIVWDDVVFFINELRGTYPFLEVAQVHPEIDWSSLLDNARDAFSILSANRFHQSGGNSKVPYTGNEISLRYDWRMLLAVMRLYLPPREKLVGPSFHAMENLFYGIYISDSLDAALFRNWPLENCTFAGLQTEICRSEYSILNRLLPIQHFTDKKTQPTSSRQFLQH